MKHTNEFKPVSVSHISPVYHNGHVRFWRMHVECAGKLTPLDLDILPETQHLIEFGEHKMPENTTVLKYSWRNGLFGLGWNRIWQFRIKILSKITEESIKQRQTSQLNNAVKTR